MGRWFGYRDGYADLCRIHMTPQAASWYAHIAEAIEELRADFKDMKAARMTPLEFGLRVRSHPTALIVTARNKMRATKEIPVSIALEGRLAETSVLLGNPDSLAENRRVLDALVVAASLVKSPASHSLGWLWETIPSALVKAAVTGFRHHPECILTYPGPLVEYIEWLEENGQKTFDVLLRSSSEEKDFKVGDLMIAPIKRTVLNATPSRIEFSKRRVASRGDERAGLSKEVIAEIKEAYAESNPGKDVPDKEYRKYRQLTGRPPLMMIMFAGIRSKDDQPITATVPAYGIGFPGDPGSQRRAQKLVQYRVNTVWWEKNVLTVEDEEDAE
jgi:hypothetical protein